MLKAENLLLGFEHLIIIFCFEELIFTLIRQMIIPILFKEQGYLTLLNF